MPIATLMGGWQAGQSARRMSREGVAGRATAARYIEAALELGLTPQPS